MHRGYTKRWRKRWDKGYHQDRLLWVMMDYFIDHVNYKDTEAYIKGVGVVEVKRGQMITGTHKLSEFLGVGRERIRARLKILKNAKFLTIKSTNRFSIVTVLNYDTYNPIETLIQPPDQPTDQPATNQQPTSNQPHLNKDNKDNNGRPFHYKVKVSIPKDFYITDEMKKYAENNLNDPNYANQFTHMFINACKAKGYKYQDWQAAWKNWLGRDIKDHPELKKQKLRGVKI